MTAATAFDELTDAILQLDGLTKQVGPVTLPAEACDRRPDTVAAVCRELEVPLRFAHLSGGAAVDHSAVALARKIGSAQRSPKLTGTDPRDAAAAAGRRRQAEAARLRTHVVARRDGATVTAVDTGHPTAPSVVLSLPGLMSFRLVLPWLARLRAHRRCVVVLTRGSSESRELPTDFDGYDHGFDHQAEDLLAVVDRLGLEAVHVMGMCAGAAAAVAAASRRPDRIASLSLWHADVELADDAARTDHQLNLRELLELAAQSRDTAEWIRSKLVSGPMTGVPGGLGPLVVRPYATTELFYRYATLTSSTMRWDCRAAAAAISRPCLVVSSSDDQLAHPEGSRRLAAVVPGARLAELPSGHHLDVFRATPAHVGLLRSFLDRPG